MRAVNPLLVKQTMTGAARSSAAARTATAIATSVRALLRSPSRRPSRDPSSAITVGTTSGPLRARRWPSTSRAIRTIACTASAG